MHKPTFIFLFVLFICSFATAQPKEEIRAAWLTTAYALDWPTTKANTPEGERRQKEELCRILDKLQAANFNTVLFQVRLRADLIYPSSIEPTSSVLTGKTGKAPTYNPLAFAVEECHKRGLELHAWLVSIPLGSKKHIVALGKSSVVHRHPAICRQHQGEWFLNPGHPQTKEYLFSIVKEIVDRYDVDGIHLDYIRYPDRPDRFPDADTFRKYGKGKSLPNWRRENITSIVRHIYKGVKDAKPWVKVSSSPIGKYKDTSRYSSFGWNAYHTVYQEAQAWLKEGIQDILFPMMYFEDNQFYPFAADWKEKCYDRHIVPGLGVYAMEPSEKDWPLSLIERQINFTRTQEHNGQAYYRTRQLMKNTKGILSELSSRHYSTIALPPPMPWLDNTPPTAPTNFLKTQERNHTKLTWEASNDNDPRAEVYYTLYASDHYPVDTSTPHHIVATRLKSCRFTHTPVYPVQYKKYFAITASDRYGNESPATQLPLKEHTLIGLDSDTLHLPPRPFTQYITITDATGRSLLNAPYTSQSIDLSWLEKGFYRILLTEESGKTIRLGDIIK